MSVMVEDNKLFNVALVISAIKIRILITCLHTISVNLYCISYSYITVGVGYLCYITGVQGKTEDEC